MDNSNTVVGYDALGNLTQKAQTIDSQTETTNYIYDARNQLKQVQVGGSTVGQFLYDANGLRIHKTETQTDESTQIANTTHQRYHYQGLNVIGSFDENNNSQYRYYHDGNQIFARINESAFSDTSVENNAVQTYHQDGLGSTAVISNRDGSLTARYQYDAFGNVQTETGQSETNDFTYTGHERDQSTGLIYAKARYYDPQLGLFLSRDPFEGYDNKPLSLHRYLYAYQNPMKYVDPDGRQACIGESIYGCSMENFIPNNQEIPQNIAADALKGPLIPADLAASGMLPVGQRANPEGHIYTENYHYVPYGNESGEVAYYTAQNIDSGTFDYYAPPSGLEMVVENEDKLQNTVEYIRSFGELRGSQVAANQMLIYGMQGQLGKAAGAFGESWKEGIQEPETYLEFGLGFAGGGALKSLGRSTQSKSSWIRPENWQGPAKDKGTWLGDIGNSPFRLTDEISEKVGVPKGTSINFVEGAPDFSAFAKPTPAGTSGSFSVEGLVYEHSKDARTIIKQLAKEAGMTQKEVRKYLAQQDVRMHHYKDDIIQLAPTKLHTGVHHTGSRALNSK